MPRARKPVGSALGPVDKFYEVMVGGWTMGGILRPFGVHKGEVQYRYKAPKSNDWFPGLRCPPAGFPKKLEDEMDAAKMKIKKTLRLRLEKADAKAAKMPTKAASKKNGLVKKTKGKN